MPQTKDKLKTYHRRRNTSASHEPAGAKSKQHIPPHKHPIFVIQKHDASHLHYDFRIEIDGVLKSWAVPKGISKNPADKRLAIPTDDHPYEYAKFHGTIPEGNYGAGTVEIFDKGTYRNLKEDSGKPVPMSTCFKNGRIEIALHGKKCKGGYALIRTRKQGDKYQWLLIKMDDAYADRTSQINNQPSNDLSPRRRPGSRTANESFNKKHAQHKGTNQQLDPGLRRDDVNQKRKFTKKIESHVGVPFVPTPEGTATPPDSTSNEPATLTIKISNHIIQLSNIDKVLFHHPDITKGDLINYYHKVAPVMLPYMHDRAVTMHRFPSGIDQEGFYQKEIGEHFPSWIKRAVLKKEGGTTTYVVCNNAATLVYLANQGCITPHLWLSHITKPNYPDRLIFDLDPGKQTFAVVRKTALTIRDALAKQKLTSWVMTTGSAGFHVVVPLDGKTPFDDVRTWAHTLANRIAVADTKHLTTELHIDKRRGRLFIDTTRNAYAQTTVAPYAVRARAGAPVATPLHWDELEDRRLSARSYSIKNVLDHLQKKGDPWDDMSRHKYSLKNRTL